jgi:hypothetical protein
MAGSQASRGRVIRPIVGGMLLASCLFMAVACSNSEPKASVDPKEAAQTIGSAYSLPDDQISCLEGAFAKNHAATRPLASDGTASDDDLRTLGQVESACIPVETLAAAIVGGASEALGTLTAAQRTCLDGAVQALDDTDRTTLIVGLAVSSALDDLHKAELGKVTNGLLGACQLSVDAGSSATTPTTAGP